jgi:cytochrome c
MLTAAYMRVFAQDSPHLGKAISESDVAAWDISIPPSGEGLPAGSGSAREGRQVYEQHCLACHGAKGVGKPADALTGGIGSLATKAPLRTVGSYWPYSTTLFDFTRRAMPWPRPRSLTNDEVYALTAFILAQNKIIGATDIMNAQTLPKVRMPNRDGFIPDPRPEKFPPAKPLGTRKRMT